MSTQIMVRDRNLDVVAELDTYSKLEMILRFNHVGTWLLDLGEPTEASGLLDFPGGIQVLRDGAAFFSGPVNDSQVTRTTRANDRTVTGSDDNVWLRRRLAYPVPTGPPYTAQSHDVRTGAAETIMSQYVDVNAGPSAQSSRRVLGLEVAPDLARGLVITGRARFQSLLSLLSDLASFSGELGFGVVQGDQNLAFSVYEPVDRTATTTFSLELGNLEGYAYGESAARVNYAITGGGGEGTARIFVEGGSPESIVDYGRVEAFLDQRQTTDLTELGQARDELLAEGAGLQNLQITPIDTEQLMFDRDYGLGDRVSVVIDGVRFDDIVREVHITLTPQGETIRPIIGTPGASAKPGLIRRLGRVEARVSGLERR